MTIDKSKQLLSHYQRLFNSLNGDYKLSIVQAAELSHAIDTALDAVSKYQQPQADYEARLRADMVAMLEKLSEKLKKIHKRYSAAEHWDEAYGVELSMEEVRKKINDLKENEDGSN